MREASAGGGLPIPAWKPKALTIVKIVGDISLHLLQGHMAVPKIAGATGRIAPPCLLCRLLH